VLCCSHDIASLIAADIHMLQATRHSLLGSTPCLQLQKSLLSCEKSTKKHKRKQADSGVKHFILPLSENTIYPSEGVSEIAL
jgi:hypothetical protein